MPELPGKQVYLTRASSFLCSEVERARKLIETACKGYKIKKVSTVEDKLVYTGGITHHEFAKELEGRTITGCERKGKNFWITLTGSGRLPMAHFGMTGMIQFKGQEPTWYRRRPKESTDVWPPKFHKFVMHLEPQKGSVSDEARELAFADPRRFGRLRLVPSPVEDHPPISALGFDPILSYPSLEEFKTLLLKKKATVKGVIMDQSFSAGVGNWVADEILYQARIHPACPVQELTEDQIGELHKQIRAVPEKAVEVNADSMRFPEDWLFRWRWDKGKKQPGGAKVKNEDGEFVGMLEQLKPKDKDFLALPNGKPATIEFIEVAGRTSAVVTELQKMPAGVDIKPKVTKGSKGGKKSRRGKADSDSVGRCQARQDCSQKG
ncbi:Formamidopyrimidine-DNA glycosylase H2TH domain-domain-containing protein [Kockovaella imperatae]|uniref:Formamidopyrimidine-DNA glycosylase H2TH domain-domain-containing protein n=1 Tax=Kockovaella imperatae TaxID=4999 RepID=A0A1Y1UBD1_9TREE|nr:Formamidopyrimidine-DNA glycosylase H2TH domain-domain-containing protein [Kockovaella imperatae]ORX35329.1 Formamidopyrimidine-DNA glycosylase H2TH domain-domain-containing protein [Kockovaella imperatae]